MSDALFVEVLGEPLIEFLEAPEEPILIDILEGAVLEVVEVAGDDPVIVEINESPIPGPPGPPGTIDSLFHIGPTPPDDTSQLWIDTSS